MTEVNIETVELAVIGGSGFCAFPEIENARLLTIDTRYGETSDRITVGSYSGAGVAFLPRHGYHHHLPPHAIPYKANMVALTSLGVKYVLGVCSQQQRDRWTSVLA